MVFYKQITWTGAAGGWSVLQLRGWWQTKQRLLCPSLRAALQKTSTAKDDYHHTPDLTNTAHDSLVHGTRKASSVCQQGRQMKMAHGSHLRYHCQRCPHLDFYHLLLFWPCKCTLLWIPFPHRSRIHSVNALGALPFQPLPGGVRRSLRACEWQLAHQHAEVETSLS